MGVPVDRVRNLDRAIIKTRDILGLLNLRQIIESLMPTGEVDCLGSKYLLVSMNFFRNDYLREVVSQRPEYNEYLRVHAGEDDYRTDRIETLP